MEWFPLVLSDSVLSTDYNPGEVIYNKTMNKAKDFPSVKQDHDYRIFYLLMTLVIAGAYISTITTNPSLREPWKLAVYTTLLIFHVTLHWFLEKVPGGKWIPIYIISQGTLAFVISIISDSNLMIFGLFMPLIGEIAGFWGLTLKSLLAISFYAALAAINFFQVTSEIKGQGWMLVIIPAAFFTILYTTMYVRQSQARERAQLLLKELEVANRQLTEYADKVEDLTITAERQRMARELHDTLSQGLAGLILQLEAVDAHLANNRMERAQAIIHETMERARSTLADARRAIDDLRQPLASDLDYAIRREVEHLRFATGIPCEMDVTLPPDLPDELSETILRIVVESLNNIARHANATKANLAIHRLADQNLLGIEIEDDGAGFDPNTSETGHYGLVGMRERTRMAGGNLEIHSKPGMGTRLVCHLPLGRINNG